MLPWRQAWQEALYGPRGFYRRPEGPAGHFTTATHGVLASVLATALAALADREQVHRIVDVGCGRGELLTRLAHTRPDLELTGCDIVGRPAALPAAVDWVTSPGGPALPDELAELTGTLVIAHEWLDVVPCTIAEMDDAGVLREVLVDPATGLEALGDPVPQADSAWVEQWWPAFTPGERVEIGRTRDAAHTELVSRVRDGVVLTIDYGHLRAGRPARGSLAAYRAGCRVAPVPDGSCDLTAHVAFDSLGAQKVFTQRAGLRDLGVAGEAPAHELARTDPAAYLAALSRASAATALRDPGGLGGFRWALTRV